MSIDGDGFTRVEGRKTQPPVSGGFDDRLSDEGRTYLAFLTKKHTPNLMTRKGWIEHELFSTLQQLDRARGLDLRGLPVEDQLAIIERRGEMLRELNERWAESIARNARLDKLQDFRRHLRELVLREKRLLDSIQRKTRTASVEHPPDDVHNAAVVPSPSRPLDTIPRPTAPSAARGPRRGSKKR